MTNKRFAAILAVCVASVVAITYLGIYVFGGHKTTAHPVPTVVAKTVPRPISDVACGRSYQFVHVERFYVEGRVAVNFYFGGDDRDRQPQYIWAENVIGQSTEVRSKRRVKPSLEYSTVTFLCLSDPSLEGHKASNVDVLRYRLTLRRPLRQQKVIRNGGPARQ